MKKSLRKSSLNRGSVLRAATGFVAGAALYATPVAKAADFYLDTNGDTAGFGSYVTAGTGATQGTGGVVGAGNLVDWQNSRLDWSSSAAGTDTPVVWANGNNVIFDATSTTANFGMRLQGDVSVTGLNLSNNTSNIRASLQSNAVAARVVTMTGGGTVDINGTGGSRISMDSNVLLQGSYTKTGTGILSFTGSGGGTFVGTATFSTGSVYYQKTVTSGVAEGLGTGSNLVINGASYGLYTGGGTYVIGSLSGSGGGITTGQDSVGNSGSTHTLQVNQATDGSFAGTLIQGSGRTLALTKQGSASLALNGNLNYTGTTTVVAGTLLINSATASVAAVSVTGGTFGGTSSVINTNGNAFTVTGGNLAPGTDGTAGTLTLTSAGTLDVSGLTSSGQLKFDLGTSSDLITLSLGTLNIGTLDFSDFTFNGISGFGAGTYTLFDTNTSILGSIGTASGTIGAFNGTLSISGQDVVLNVSAVPEPSTWVLLLGGCGAVFLLRRKVKAVSVVS